MIILAIETSCDDTCCAIVEAFGKKKPSFRILSNIVSSQTEIHKQYGGVYPTLARREHQKNLPKVLKQALKGAKLLESGVDLIAVTIGPGLEPCLWVGVNFAKDLAQKWNLPIIPVNHIEAHILANWSNQAFGPRRSKRCLNINFPAICLVVSGGTTQLILTRDIGKYKILGETRDDAAGECFDKTARLLGLGYPGGPAIVAAVAKITNSKFKIKLPRPMLYSKNYDFSFSGLKTAVLYHFKNQPRSVQKSKQYIQAMAAEIQQAIIDVLIKKTMQAAKQYQARTIILGGGVASNIELRKQFQGVCSIPGIEQLNFLAPAKKFCTDNAAMVALTGYFNWLRSKTVNLENIEAKANLRLCS